MKIKDYKSLLKINYLKINQYGFVDLNNFSGFEDIFNKIEPKIDIPYWKNILDEAWDMNYIPESTSDRILIHLLSFMSIERLQKEFSIYNKDEILPLYISILSRMGSNNELEKVGIYLNNNSDIRKIMQIIDTNNIDEFFNANRCYIANVYKNKEDYEKTRFVFFSNGYNQNVLEELKIDD